MIKDNRFLARLSSSEPQLTQHRRSFVTGASSLFACEKPRWSRLLFLVSFQLAQELSNAAQSLNRAAVAAERLARFLTDVDFEASSSEQQTQFMAALSATKDLHTTFSLSTAVETTKKRRRKDKDPDAPKRPITSYLIFQEAKRKEITAKHPELPYKEVLKLLGIEWKNMSDADKEVCFLLIVSQDRPVSRGSC